MHFYHKDFAVKSAPGYFFWFRLLSQLCGGAEANYYYYYYLAKEID
jgi:hypothetical protein